jgi:hypothetical protein
MPMTSGGWQNVTDAILREVVFLKFREIPSMLPNLYNIEKSDSEYEHLLGVSSGGDFQKFTGTVNKSNFSEVYKTTIEHDEYTNSFEVTQKLYDDDKWGVMKKRATALAISARRTKEKQGFDLFNHAFDTTYTGGDALQLCSTAPQPSQVFPTKATTGHQPCQRPPSRPHGR